MRTIYWVWSMILFVAIVIQVGLAGYGAFYAASKLEDEGSTIDEDVFFDGFGLHAGFGYLVVLLGLVFLVLGVIAGIGRWRLGQHGLLFALLILQVLLAWFGFEAPVIGFFHPVNALLIFGLAGSIAFGEWRLRKAEASPTIA
ncbi:MAG: hypothetical protein H0U08_00295 [Actinobacteria bacterium]|nr:hypothetical protein [Actinomycetota bacterium]